MLFQSSAFVQDCSQQQRSVGHRKRARRVSNPLMGTVAHGNAMGTKWRRQATGATRGIILCTGGKRQTRGLAQTASYKKIARKRQTSGAHLPKATAKTKSSMLSVALAARGSLRILQQTTAKVQAAANCAKDFSHSIAGGSGEQH